MGFRFDSLRVPCLMGVVNVTPNSFSDGGDYLAMEKAVGRGRELVRDGAMIVDVGAEASSFFREGVEAVGAEEQWRRLAGVVEGLRRPQMYGGRRFWMSVDTRLAEVARRAVLAGAAIVNDISAGTFDEGMLAAVAERRCGIVLMHISESYPENAKEDDGDIVRMVGEYLTRRVEAAMAAGVKREAIAVDPGVGFGKTGADNWRLVMGCGAYKEELGVEVVLGASRKRFLEVGTPAEVLRIAEEFVGKGEHVRDALSAAVVKVAAGLGVGIHRVHDARLAAQALGM